MIMKKRKIIITAIMLILGCNGNGTVKENRRKRGEREREEERVSRS